MTEKNIEQEFFEVFRIEPKEIYEYKLYWAGQKKLTKSEYENLPDKHNWELKENLGKIYPPITPEIVLGMLQIILNNEMAKRNVLHRFKFYYSDENEINIKEILLKICIKIQKDDLFQKKVQEQIKELFDVK